MKKPDSKDNKLKESAKHFGKQEDDLLMAEKSFDDSHMPSQESHHSNPLQSLVAQMPSKRANASVVLPEEGLIDTKDKIPAGQEDKAGFAAEVSPNKQSKLI